MKIQETTYVEQHCGRKYELQDLPGKIAEVHAESLERAHRFDQNQLEVQKLGAGANNPLAQGNGIVNPHATRLRELQAEQLGLQRELQERSIVLEYLRRIYEIQFVEYESMRLGQRSRLP